MGKMIKEVRSRAMTDKDRKDFAKYEKMFERPRSGDLIARDTSDLEEIEKLLIELKNLLDSNEKK